MKENTSYKIVALLITMILWVIILGSKESVMTKMVPVEFILPHGMTVGSDVPKEVAFKAAGPRLVLKKFSELKEPLVIDLSAALPGVTTVRLHADSINTPPGVRILSVSPSTVTPRLEKMFSKRVPVEINIRGKLPDSKKLSSMRVIPVDAEIFGSKEILTAVKSVSTAPIELERVSVTQTLEVPLMLEEIGLEKSKEAVKVEIILE